MRECLAMAAAMALLAMAGTLGDPPQANPAGAAMPDGALAAGAAGPMTSITRF